MAWRVFAAVSWPCCLGPQSQALCLCLHSDQGACLNQVNTSGKIQCGVGIIYWR